jgi:hypothetical protein
MPQSPVFPLHAPPPSEKRHAYIDTFRVWLPHHLHGDLQVALREMDPRMHYEPARDGDFRIRRYVVRLTFQKATKEIIELLEGNTRRPTVNAVHLALDLVFANQKDSLLAGDFINAHILKPYHRGSVTTPEKKKKKKKSNEKLNTTYYGPRWGRNTWAVYGDKSYRHGPGYACHIEARIQGREAVAQRGINSLRDLLAFDHRAFWQRNLKLVEFDRRRLGKRVTGQHLSSAPRITRHGTFTYDSDLRAADTYLRALESPTAVIAKLRHHDMATTGIYHELDASPYLP